MKKKPINNSLNLIITFSIVLLSVIWIILSWSNCREVHGKDGIENMGFFTWFAVVVIILEITSLVRPRLCYMIGCAIGWFCQSVGWCMYIKLTNYMAHVLGSIVYVREPDGGRPYCPTMEILLRGKWCVAIGCVIGLIYVYLLCKRWVEYVKRRKFDRRSDN